MENNNEVMEMEATETTENYDLIPAEDAYVFNSDEYEVVDEDEYNSRYANGMVAGGLIALAAAGLVAGGVKLVKHFKKKKADKMEAAAAKERMDEYFAEQAAKREEIDFIEGDEVDPEE